MFALIRNGAVAKYPYSIGQLRNDNPQVSFPTTHTQAILDAFGVVTVAAVTKPDSSNAITKNVVEGTPVLVAGTWTQVWSEENATAEQIAIRTAYAAEVADKAAVKADSFVSQFIAMTPAQVATYVENNVTNLATAKTVIAKLGQMLLLLARREFT